MNKISTLMSLAVISAGLLFFTSCDNGNGGEEIPKKTGVLIVNAGNFGSGNGTISFYDEELGTISNNVIKKVSCKRFITWD